MATPTVAGPKVALEMVARVQQQEESGREQIGSVLRQQETVAEENNNAATVESGLKGQKEQVEVVSGKAKEKSDKGKRTGRYRGHLETDEVQSILVPLGGGFGRFLVETCDKAAVCTTEGEWITRR
nr:PREDICTED: uncharacterized protein LOC106705929 [Latimeria chalumnae]|eukprot:XP_014351575.1 PREDICTED: uncharacterized protein LOC106705929 [Latimeria chalumnae]